MYRYWPSTLMPDVPKWINSFCAFCNTCSTRTHNIQRFIGNVLIQILNMHFSVLHVYIIRSFLSITFPFCIFRRPKVQAIIFLSRVGTAHRCIARHWYRNSDHLSVFRSHACVKIDVDPRCVYAGNDWSISHVALRRFIANWSSVDLLQYVYNWSWSSR